MGRERIAVLFVHGVEIDDGELAVQPMQLLSRRFTAIAGVPAEDVLVMRAALWGAALHRRQEELFRRCLGGGEATAFSQQMTDLVKQVNAGSWPALLKLVARTVWPFPLGESGLQYPALRWFVLHLLGDAVSYQRVGGDDVYREVHDSVSEALGELATEAGPDATLCVIAHSLGTVIATNHFDNLRREPGEDGTALQRGETLGFLYTLGCPMAVWAASYPESQDLGEPIPVPAPGFPLRHPELGWTNILYREDVVGYPLQPLGGRYAERVKDRVIDVGPLPLRNNPLAHLWYWHDRAVIDPIATSLAKFWAARPRR
ncbi:hypothetical protein ACVGVM_27155 [Pseudonocardia bannensis]|uniref:Uncharacterized protein n=1 Tax=Pseudonocardia bannensis TaxID=630973 RepID=A0A848DH80_9PSEU|nr:hypothetical protein [Pseudonocardia bannensis]NMH91926.1 hypothetical protein [Pseudonocardia bannensis]